MATLIHTLADHSDDVNYCAFSTSCLATCSLDKTIRVYSLSDFTELPYSPLEGHAYAVHCCCFSPSGRVLASCSTDGTAALWDSRDGRRLAVLQQPGASPVRVCRFSPEATYLLAGAADGSVVLWNVQSLKLYRSGKVKGGSLMACAFSPNGNFFVTGSSSGDLTIWDDKMRCLYNEKAHDLGVTCCDISSHPVSDSENGVKYFQMASCGQDNQIKLWLILFADFLGVQLKYKCTLNGHSAPVLACAFSCDGRLIVSGVLAISFILCLSIQGDTVENESKVAVQDWSEDDVSAWLCTQDLADFVGLFKMNNIDGKELLNLTKESLANELKIESLGLRSKVLKKIEELRMTMISVSVPDEFLCPITRELMNDPVIATDGYSYEREAMENWISNRRSSPMTNLPLHSLMLTPNRTLKMAISRWLENQQK
ncbi:WD repeat, SAM and U-box domain-containing protein 1 isoform X4 [Cyanistes caeruleus]|uniref:WD repeat, SAM and U-box domain-containing protein 1 isoform X4 n=1 Tax=Cyanistes caeruleus TaxID=156563 RepID=UPI000CDAE56A|nr:WD repeat, SAM and U-box domain-containing protein 1 isoform X4 [Cyanistes caeruleus]